MDRFNRAWRRIRPAALAWGLTYFVFGVAAAFSYGLAIVVLPNLVRASRHGLANDAAPDISTIFVFDQIAEDAVAMLILLLACTIFAIPNPALAVVPAVALFWTPILAAEEDMDGTEAVKTSAFHVRDHLVDIGKFMLTAAFLNLLGVVTCIGWAFTLPATVVAALELYDERRDELRAAAVEAGWTVNE